MGVSLIFSFPHHTGIISSHQGSLICTLEDAGPRNEGNRIASHPDAKEGQGSKQGATEGQGLSSVVVFPSFIPLSELTSSWNALFHPLVCALGLSLVWFWFFFLCFP